MTMLTMSDRYLYAARFKSYLGHFEEAEAILTEALEHDPDNAVVLRNRGHRRITLRKYDEALEDLTRASEVIHGTPDEHEFYQRDTEPDIVNIILDRMDDVREQHIPVNADTIAATKGMYKSTLHGSVWYHLGVVKYLKGAFDDFGRSQELGVDDDSLIATFDWRYMALRRLGRDDEAAKLLEALDTTTLEVADGEDFYLRRLKLYKGELTPEMVLDDLSRSLLALATQGYGVGNWFLYNGDEAAAHEIFERVIEHGTPNAFGYMAAEAELARMGA
jgi:tetratricopeptide (TPR) repeat protein